MSSLRNLAKSDGFRLDLNRNWWKAAWLSHGYPIYDWLSQFLTSDNQCVGLSKQISASRKWCQEERGDREGEDYQRFLPKLYPDVVHRGGGFWVLELSLAHPQPRCSLDAGFLLPLEFTQRFPSFAISEGHNQVVPASRRASSRSCRSPLSCERRWPSRRRRHQAVAWRFGDAVDRYV